MLGGWRRDKAESLSRLGVSTMPPPPGDGERGRRLEERCLRVVNRNGLRPRAGVDDVIGIRNARVLLFFFFLLLLLFLFTSNDNKSDTRVTHCSIRS